MTFMNNEYRSTYGVARSVVVGGRQTQKLNLTDAQRHKDKSHKNM